jgi:pyruvate,orthophosphate dikinase
VILVRKETNPDDVHGMIGARGILTANGGMTSHAAVVARGMGKPAVTGCSALQVNPEAGEIVLAGRRLRSGEVITIEGSSGVVAVGEVPLVEPDPGEDFGVVLSWADGMRDLGVRANADTPEDARRARELGAEGIGLCRTEHMFMEDGRLETVRRMILAEDEVSSEQALSELEPLQQPLKRRAYSASMRSWRSSTRWLAPGSRRPVTVKKRPESYTSTRPLRLRPSGSFAFTMTCRPRPLGESSV